ncbi:MAG TPA: fatty acid CoA ligase family protein [Opitutaceae bacterium]|nr:fatty acid CoA ligase family protein [Opitutaceae bacterium]
MSDSANIAQHLPLMARRQPDAAALKIPRGRTRERHIDYLTLSFAELDRETDAWVERLVQNNVQPGDRVLLMVKQGLPLIAAAFALFKHGAVPVVIDPGMGMKNFLSCVERSQPRVLLGIPLAQIISRIFRGSFRSVRIRIATSARATHRLAAGGASVGTRPPISRSSTDLAAILFTSGSTGAPKGVCYEHGMFAAQVEAIRETYGIQPGEIDLPMLPIFALFNPALGMTTIVPEIDPRRPAQVDPEKIVQAILQENVTNSFGSPTLWRKIGTYCIEKHVTLPSVKRVLCAGAAVPDSLWRDAAKFLPNGRLFSPYGATEALPISSVGAAQIEAERTARAGADWPGACLGRPIAAADVRIIALTDGPIISMDEAGVLPPGQIGEIVVTGPMVTKYYDALPQATTLAKIPEKRLAEPRSAGLDTGPQVQLLRELRSARVWHRMGDCGMLDERGVLWFLGRKVERVLTEDGVLFTEPCERVFRAVEGVHRCALIGLGQAPRQNPALVVEPVVATLGDEGKRALAARLREVGRASVVTGPIQLFFFHSDFPVDVRHNAKIHRLTLTKWAVNQKAIKLP